MKYFKIHIFKHFQNATSQITITTKKQKCSKTNLILVFKDREPNSNLTARKFLIFRSNICCLLISALRFVPRNNFLMKL